MSAWRWERHAPLAGIAAVVLWIVGFLLFLGTEVEGADTAPEILAGYNNDENAILFAGWIFVLGGVLFLWFLGSLRARLLSAEGAPGRLTAVAFAAGIAAAVFLMTLPLGDISGALADNLEPAAAQALNEIGTAAFVGAEFSTLALVVATALVVLRTGVLPRWLAWASLVLGLILLIGPIGWLGLIFAFPLWVVVVSVLLWTGTDAPGDERAQLRPETPV